MTSISSSSKPNFHARSASFPSRSSQISEFNDLNNLYSSFDNLLLLASAKKVQNEEVNEFLDALLVLLELCSIAKDGLLSTRDSAQELQSVLRRKRGDSIELTAAVQEYQSKRKTVKKAIVKSMRHLKGSSIKKIQETPLREVESVTLRVLESFLCFILGSSSKNSNKWSLVSKMLNPKQVASNESSEGSLVGKVDVELAKKFTCLNIENVQVELAQMESSIEDLQEGLECIYRHLIKTRVSLLNLFN